MSTQVNTMKTGADIRKLVTMAMLSAIGIVLVAIFEIPIMPAAPFLKYDPADIPILIGTLIYGPAAGLIMTFVVSFVQSFMLHGSGGVIGFVMHVIATGAMVLVTGVMYKYGKKNLPWAAVSLFFGAIAMIIAMVGMNLVLTPIFMNTPVSVVKDMLVPVIIPFNAIKAGLNCVISFGLFRVVEKMALRQ